jgi:hypothetical protein
MLPNRCCRTCLWTGPRSHVTISVDMESLFFTSGRNGRTGAVLLIGFCAVSACGRSGLTPRDPAAVGGSGVEAGGVVGTDGTGGLGTGGLRPASGGWIGSGGAVGSGGSSGTLALGGTPMTGGAKASGGTTTKNSGGSSGSLGSGGLTGTGGNKGTGGTVATGGSSTGGSAGCSDVAPCGGDTTGTWVVTSSCLNVSGELDMSLVGLGCASAQVSGRLQVTGDWTGKSNGRYSDSTTTSGIEQLSLPASCLQVSGTTITCSRIDAPLLALGYDPTDYNSINCSSLSSGGCTCSAAANQAGWPGLLSLDASTNGKYTTLGTILTLDDEASYSYCVSGNKMTWTPRSKYPSITGTIVFQKAGGGG